MINSFVAIDFETASYSSLSACSLGIAVFNNGALAESKHWLLKPGDCGKFSFTKVHGITWDDVKYQPSLKEICGTAPQSSRKLFPARP
jgi:DNA polymerase-3 subunit epsilon